jgi:hypothetical protein
MNDLTPNPLVVEMLTPAQDAERRRAAASTTAQP